MTLIKHSATVIKQNQTQITLVVEQKSACASCHSQCQTNSECNNIQIDIECDGTKYKVGDKLNVVMKGSLGNKALWLCYAFPIILVVLVLVITSQFIKQEWLTGIIALASLGPYFLWLKFNQQKLKKEFTFAIERLE